MILYSEMFDTEREDVQIASKTDVNFRIKQVFLCIAVWNG